MARISNPVLFSQKFNINPEKLNELGVFDPLLNVDAKLFIDPLLLGQSKHPEMRVDAVKTYREYFEKVIKLLHVSSREGDVPWRNAERLLSFPEVQGTCLGYGASSIHGSGWGPELRKQVLHTAKEIIQLGIEDPDLFVVMALFEERVGPDRISDMVTNIIFRDMVKFNQRIIVDLAIPTFDFDINGERVKLIRNPLENKPLSVILVPQDILRELPIARDWNEVGDAAYKNQQLRQRVSEQIGDIWKAKTIKDKEEIKRRALSNKASFSSLLDAVRAVDGKSYDFIRDPKGEVAWRQMLGRRITSEFPLELSLDKNPNVEDVYSVVMQIVNQFSNLIENQGIWKELWAGSKPRPEKSAQRLFFAVAVSYCKANNIDVTPEADSGNGPVDFKFSFGYGVRILVEIKLSSNNKLVAGYGAQLEAYKTAEGARRAIYLVLDVGRMGKKDQKIMSMKNQAVQSGEQFSEIIFIDGKKRPSASKR